MFDLPNPYEGFNYEAYSIDIHGWGSDSSIFKDVIYKVSPRTIIEVGTWKGASAIHMADICNEATLANTKIICIDTWLGALEFWKNLDDKDRYVSLNTLYGFPQVYYQFLANVCYTGHQDRIVPLPMTSAIGARFLHDNKVRGDLIYVDASHDYEDVLADIRAYWPLLNVGGIMFGDDYNTWEGVRDAVQDSGIPFKCTEDGRHWYMERVKR
jgi:hypothetical protein